MSKSGKLKKELKLKDVYAIATGTTLSAGFFLLPGIAAMQVGPSFVLAYIIAAIPLVPSMFSIVELATAMPRAGGVYYFLDRTLGPFVGTIGGVGTWLALILKVSFALVGMGAYISIFVPNLPITPIAIGFAVALGILNLFGSKKSGGFQVLLVIGLLAILLFFIASGLPKADFTFVKTLLDPGFSNIFGAAGLVYISYVGITKVASLSEEVKDPEKNLPLGIFLSLGTAMIIYVLGTVVMAGVIPIDELRGELTPAATAAKYTVGEIGVILVSVAALFAFISVANAGTLSASRYPLAMSRDHIMPRLFQNMFKNGVPYISVIITVSVIILILLFLDPTGIAKLASAFQLLMFALVCVAVIVMRESKLDSYDPGYKSPLYPWMQIFGVVSSFYLIAQMGLLPIVFSSGLVLLGLIWYRYYVRKQVLRTGAIYHIFERLGRFRYEGLDSELRGILKEKGLRAEDPFDEIVANGQVLDIDSNDSFEVIVKKVSEWIALKTPNNAEDIEKQFLKGTRIGVTPITHGMALPHLRIKGIEKAILVMVRSKDGIKITYNNPLTDAEEFEEAIVNAIFFLVSPDSDPTQHLRILAKIAGRVEDEYFMDEWTAAENEIDLKRAMLHDDRCLNLIVDKNALTSEFIGKRLMEIDIPDGSLVAWIRRGDEMIVPRGSIKFIHADRLTIIGEPKSLLVLKEKYELE